MISRLISFVSVKLQDFLILKFILDKSLQLGSKVT